MSYNSILFLNSIGLIFDIIGAWLVASEVVQQFRGKKFEDVRIGGFRIGSPGDEIVKETPEYKLFDAAKYYRMKWGLAFLTLGFFLQILSNLFQIIFQ